MKQTYILISVEPDDSGNDDGVLDRQEMTATEANEKNIELYNGPSGTHWLPAVPVYPRPPITHID